MKRGVAKRRKKQQNVLLMRSVSESTGRREQLNMPRRRKRPSRGETSRKSLSMSSCVRFATKGSKKRVNLITT
jgi:hypothetical protein